MFNRLKSNKNETLTKEQKLKLDQNDAKVKDGIITCKVCEAYCGQCPSNHLGMPVDEYFRLTKL